jgi:uncharacterized YccA/Bax inhibitor family protein
MTTADAILISQIILAAIGLFVGLLIIRELRGLRKAAEKFK